MGPLPSARNIGGLTGWVGPRMTGVAVFSLMQPLDDKRRSPMLVLDSSSEVND